MTAAQKLIVWDYLRRWRWPLILGCFLHLAFMTAAAWTGKYSFIGMLFGSAILLHFETARGGGIVRSLLCLPVTAAELGRCWRFVGFTLPAIAAFVILSIGTLLGAVFGAPHISAQTFIIAAIGQPLLLGAIFFAFVGITVKADVAVPKFRFTNVLAGLMVGFALPFLLLIMTWPLTGKWADMGQGKGIVGVVLVATTLAGWFQAEDAALRRLAKPGDCRKSPKPSSDGGTLQWQGFGGIGYLLLRTGTQLALMSAAIVTLGLGIPKLLGTSMSNYTIIGMFIFFSFYFGEMALVAQLRTLRTLPLSRRTLAHLLVLWPWTLIMVLYAIPGLIAFVMFGDFNHWLRWDLAIFATVGATFFTPLILRYDLKWGASMSLMLLVMGFALLEGFSHSPFDWRLVLMIGAAVLALVWTLTYRLLGSPHPWRAGAFRPSLQTRRMG